MKKNVVKIALMGLAVGSMVSSCSGSKPKEEQKMPENNCSNKSSCSSPSSCSNQPSDTPPDNSNSDNSSSNMQQKREAPPAEKIGPAIIPQKVTAPAAPKVSAEVPK